MFIKKIVKFIIIRLRYWNKVQISFSADVPLKSSFEGMCKIHPNTTFNGKLGLGSYIGIYCMLSANIGRFTSISNHVICNPGIHPYQAPFATTSPCFYSLNPTHTQCGSTFATEQLFEEQRLPPPLNTI